MTSPLTKEKPLVVYLRLTGEPKARIIALMARVPGNQNDYAMAGLMREVARLEQTLPAISHADMAIITQARQLGIDPVAALTQAIEAHLSQQATPA